MESTDLLVIGAGPIGLAVGIAARQAGDQMFKDGQIVIKPETRYVNVTGGEVIRFEVGNKSFVWNFNGQRSSFDLARVAPTAVLDHKVTAYVAPNPMYPRRR